MVVVGSFNTVKMLINGNFRKFLYKTFGTREQKLMHKIFQNKKLFTKYKPPVNKATKIMPQDHKSAGTAR